MSDMQLYYKETKSGVDVVDAMCKAYCQDWSSQYTGGLWSACTTWWMWLGYAFMLFNLSHPNWITVVDSKRRRLFLQQLASELANEHMLLRLQDPTGLSTELVTLITKASGQRNPRQSASLQEDQEAPLLYKVYQMQRERRVNLGLQQNSSQVPRMRSNCMRPTRACDPGGMLKLCINLTEINFYACRIMFMFVLLENKNEFYLLSLVFLRWLWEPPLVA